MKRYLLGFSLAVACVVLAQAFSFEPISQNFAPAGRDASHVFRVNNTTAERIAVQVSVRPRRIEADGTEVQGKESEEFVVYPRQMLLDPGEQRSVRVRWIGPEEIDSERPFRIIAEQLPVDFGDEQPLEGAAIRLTYRYEGVIYVVPPGATPDLSISSVVADTTEGGRTLEFEIRNSGTRHALLEDLVINLRSEQSGDSEITLRAVDLPGIAGENMLAQSVRRFRIPAPVDLWYGPIYADMEYSPE